MSARERQIAALKHYAPGVTQDSPDSDRCWSFNGLDHTGVLYLIINIALPPGFPTEAPELTCNPVFFHNWVDQRSGRISHPHLSNWHSNYNLGLILVDMTKELLSNYRKLGGLPFVQEKPAITPAAYADLRIREMDNLSDEELREIVRSESALDKFVRSTSIYADKKAELVLLKSAATQYATEARNFYLESKALREDLINDIDAYNILVAQTVEIRTGPPGLTHEQLGNILHKLELACEQRAIPVTTKAEFLSARKELHKVRALAELVQSELSRV